MIILCFLLLSQFVSAMDPVKKNEIATNDGIGTIVEVKGVGTVVLANHIQEIVMRKKIKKSRTKLTNALFYSFL